VHSRVQGAGSAEPTGPPAPRAVTGDMGPEQGGWGPRCGVKSDTAAPPRGAAACAVLSRHTQGAVRPLAGQAWWALCGAPRRGVKSLRSDSTPRQQRPTAPSCLPTPPTPPPPAASKREGRTPPPAESLIPHPQPAPTLPPPLSPPPSFHPPPQTGTLSPGGPSPRPHVDPLTPDKPGPFCQIKHAPRDPPLTPGIYWGSISTPHVNPLVESADITIAVGTVWTDYSTLGYSVLLKPAHVSLTGFERV
jgi:hypothetical protein